ncbi:MAG TPA: hypothetical protein VIU93_13355 [Gallionellaceae bacterium]
MKYLIGVFVLMLLVFVASAESNIWPPNYVIEQYIRWNTPLGSSADDVRKFIAKKQYKIDYEISEPFDQDHRLDKQGDKYLRLHAYSYRFVLDQDVQVVWVFEKNILIDIVAWTDFDAP